jgi:hypothetical protein
MRSVCIVVVLAVTLTISGGTDEKAKPSPTPTQIQGAVSFNDRLIQIAGEYETYRKADRILRWAPLHCPFAPDQDGKIRESRARLRYSASGDSRTHGRKLYHVFARHVWESRPDAREEAYGSYINFPKGESPVGQVIVKQSWVPEEVEKGAVPRKDMPIQIVERDGRHYRASRKDDLYIMYKLDPATERTDRGWVYGIVSADGKRVISAGRLDACMKCHVDAPHDRLFGLPEEQQEKSK